VDATVISRYAGMGVPPASPRPSRGTYCTSQVRGAASNGRRTGTHSDHTPNFPPIVSTLFKAVESDPASRSEPAWGSDWPRLTSKSSDIEGTGRHLWQLPERIAQPSYFARASTTVCHR